MRLRCIVERHTVSTAAGTAVDLTVEVECDVPSGRVGNEIHLQVCTGLACSSRVSTEDALLHRAVGYLTSWHHPIDKRFGDAHADIGVSVMSADDIGNGSLFRMFRES